MGIGTEYKNLEMKPKYIPEFRVWKEAFQISSEQQKQRKMNYV